MTEPYTYREPLRGLAPEPDDIAADLLRASLRRQLTGARAQVQLGRYTLGARLGAGGMGTVYAAHDPKLDRPVAIKVLHDVANDGLRREAQCLAHFSHPHVVEVFDIGSDPATGRTWIAMELVDGVHMRQWLRESAPSRAEIQTRLLATADALAAMHRAGLSHGDFKPDNVLVGDATTKVVDFGLARLVAHAPQSDSVSGKSTGARSTNRSRTRGGGTAGYIAPERAAGGPPTPGGDQFAFCVTAFETLHGRRPVPGYELPLKRTRNSVGARFDAVLSRGLDPDPRRRFDSMDTLVNALKSAIRPRRHGRTAAISGGIVALTLGGFAIGSPVRPDATPTQTPAAGASEPTRDPIFEARFAQTQAELTAGAMADARIDAAALMAMAEDSGEPRSLAAAYLMTGKVDEFSGSLERAAEAYTKARDIAWAADLTATTSHAALQLVQFYAMRLHDPPRAAQALRMAASLLRRMGTDPEEDADFLLERGKLQLVQDDTKAARVSFARVVELLDHSEPTLDLAYALQGLAATATLNDPARGRAAAERSLSLFQDLLPADSPTVAEAFFTLSSAKSTAGDPDGARDAAVGGLEIYDRVQGPKTTNVAAAHRMLGELARASGKTDQAREHLLRGLAVLDEIQPNEVLVRASLHASLGALAHGDGDLSASERAYQRSLDLIESRYGPDHSNMIGPLVGLCYLRNDQQRPADALVLADHALRIVGDAPHPYRDTTIAGREAAARALAEAGLGRR